MKKLLKNKKDITTLLIFLTAGNIIYGIDVSKDYTNEKVIINPNGNGMELRDKNLNITNNGVISGTGFNWDSANGILGYTENKNSTIGNVINNGIIISKNLDQWQKAGSGIQSYNPNGNSSIGNITNNGIISGNIIANFFKKSSINVYSSENSSIGNITNTGVIDSSIRSYAENSNTFVNSNIKNIFNTGVLNNVEITAYSTKGSTTKIGNIYNNGITGAIKEASSLSDQTSSTMGNIENIGTMRSNQNTILLNSNLNLNLVTTGIAKIGNIKNDGIILDEKYCGIKSMLGEKAIPHSIFPKYIYGNIGDIYNNGVIGGLQNAIWGNFSSLMNNGILVGQIIVSTDSLDFIKNGIEILLDKNGNIINIKNGLGGEVVLKNNIKKTILNADIMGKDSFITTLSETNYENNIINGAGISKGTLIVNGKINLADSIVNGYNTALYLEDNSILGATNTSFNGGGLKNDIAVIKGSSGNNIINISGNSIINGNTDLGAGSDILTLANTVQVNGNLEGGAGIDFLNLGLTDNVNSVSNLNIFNKITGFENIAIKGNITLFETAKINSDNTKGNINLVNGNLTLRVNPAERDNLGRIIGHAFYNKTGNITINSSVGKLIIGLNGLGENSIIAMDGTTINKKIDNLYSETDKIITNSLVLDAFLQNNGDLKIEVVKYLPPIHSLLYKNLNKIYQSTVSAGEIGVLANTTLLEKTKYEESLSGLLSIFDQIYANNPYAYTLKSSRDSLKLFEDNISYLTIKPRYNELIIQGKGIYTGAKRDNSASGKNYYGFDTGHRNYKTTANTSGGLATIEYGLSNKTSIGAILGGNNQNINFKGSSKIKGNSLYLGIFTKININNFKLINELGYQYTSAQTDRRVSNMYNSFNTSDRYNINSLNIFTEIKYTFKEKDNWILEPKAKLSYFYINQDNINEKYTLNQLSIAVDRESNNNGDLELGVDFIKKIDVEQGKLKNILSLGVINTIGNRSKNLNGYVIGRQIKGSNFNIQGVKLPKISGKVAYNLELEKENGMIYTAGVNIEFAKNYNRNVNATIGIGYKFN